VKNWKDQIRSTIDRRTLYKLNYLGLHIKDQGKEAAWNGVKNTHGEKITATSRTP